MFLVKAICFVHPACKYRQLFICLLHICGYSIIECEGFHNLCNQRITFFEKYFIVFRREQIQIQLNLCFAFHHGTVVKEICNLLCVIFGEQVCYSVALSYYIKCAERLEIRQSIKNKADFCSDRNKVSFFQIACG